MMHKIALSAFAFALLATAHLSAQVTLQHRTQPGEKLQTGIDKVVKQTLTINDNDIETSVEEHSLLEATAGERKDGLLPVEHRFTAWQAEINVAGQTIKFDAANPDEGDDDSPLSVLLDGYRAVARTPFTLVLDESGEVVQFRGWENLTDDFDEKSKQLHRGMFDAEHQREVWNAEQARLPADPVKPGDTWQRTSQYRVHGGQNLTFHTQYKYVGTVEEKGRRLDKVEARTTRVEFQVDADDTAPLKIDKSELKVDSSDGYYLFDRERGKIVFSKEKLHIVGDLTLKLTNQDKELPGKVDLTMDIETRLLN